MGTVLVFAVALALTIAGVAFIYWPAALIAAGVLLAGSVWLYEAGGE
jgi:hypothetical protein